MISGHFLWSWKGRNSPFQPFHGSSNTQSPIIELLCPPQYVQPPLTSERQQSEGEEQPQGHQSHGDIQKRGCFSLSSVLDEVQSLKRSAKMRHGHRRLFEWVGEHRGVSGMCLLSCSLSLSVIKAFL